MPVDWDEYEPVESDYDWEDFEPVATQSPALTPSAYQPDIYGQLRSQNRGDPMSSDTGLTQALATDLFASLPQSLANRIQGQNPIQAQEAERQQAIAAEQERQRVTQETLAGVEEISPALKAASVAETGVRYGLRLPFNVSNAISDVAGVDTALDYWGVPHPGGRSWEQSAEENLQYWADKERRAYAGDEQLTGGGTGYELLGGTTRALTELPFQALAGMGAATVPQAVARSAAAGGLIQGSNRYLQDRGEGRSRVGALPGAILSGVITGLTTRAFGATGAEAIFRRDGVKGVTNRIKAALVDAGYEGAEEAVDQSQQDILDRIDKNPDKPIEESIRDVLMAGAVGALVGGTVGGAQALRGGVRKSGQPGIQRVVGPDGNIQIIQDQPATKVDEANEALKQATEAGPLKPLSDTEQEELFQLQQIEKAGQLDLESGKRLYDLERVASGEVQSINPEFRTDVDEAIKEMGADVEIRTDYRSDDPFAGMMATINRKTGKVVVNPVGLNFALENIPKERHKEFLNSLLSEEQIHLKTSDRMARNFIKNATWLEKAIARRRYSGTLSGRSMVGDKEVGDTNLGHEMLRMHVQLMHGMTPTEIARFAGKGYKGKQAATRVAIAMEKAIFDLRESLETTASQRQRAYLDKVSNNLKQARVIIESGAGGEGEEPAALVGGDVEKYRQNQELMKHGLRDAHIERMTPDQIKEQLSKPIPSQEEDARRFWEIKDQIAAEPDKKKQMMLSFSSNRELEFIKNRNEASPGNPPERPSASTPASPRIPNYREKPKTSNDYYATITSGFRFLESISDRPNFKEEIDKLRGYIKTRKTELQEAADAAQDKIENGDEDADEDFFVKVEAAITDSEKFEVMLDQLESSTDQGEQSFPASPRMGMSEKAKRLAEQRRRIVEMQAAARGEELPQELKTKPKEAEFPAVPPKERVGLEAGGVKPPSPREISEKAAEVLNMPIKRQEGEKSYRQLQTGRVKWDKPTFKAFKSLLDPEGWGKSMNPGAIREAWEEAVWSNLIKAPGERIESLRKSMGMERSYGSRPVQDAKEAIPPGLKGEAKMAAESKQRYRSKLVTAIATQLITESMGERAELNRESVGIDDIDFENEKTNFGTYHEISRDDLEDPQRLNKILRDQWRGSSVDPETASRRLVAVVDKRGKVFLLSTYNDAGIQRVTEPAGVVGRTKPNRVLDKNFIDQYRPFASVLLKDPVQGLHQGFENLAEFNDKIAEEASERSNIGEYEGVPEGKPDEDFEAEGTPGIEGEGGGFRGPGKGSLPVESRHPALKSKVPVTSQEGQAMLSHVMDTVDNFESIDDVKSALEDLKDLAAGRGHSIWAMKSARIPPRAGSDKVKRAAKIAQLTREVRATKKQLTAREIAAINGYRKVFGALEKANPDMSQAELTDVMASKLMEVEKASDSSEDFGDRIVREFGKPTPPQVTQEARSKTAKELTAPAIRPPTSQKEFAGPFQTKESPTPKVG